MVIALSRGGPTCSPTVSSFRPPMSASRADELLLDMVATTKGIYFDPHWVEWADAWLSGRDRSAVSAERILRRIRALQDRQDPLGPEVPDDATDPSAGAARHAVHELADLLTKLPSGIAFAVTLAAADVRSSPEDSQAALDAARAMIQSFDYLRRLRGR